MAGVIEWDEIPTCEHVVRDQVLDEDDTGQEVTPAANEIYYNQNEGIVLPEMGF